MATQSNEPNEGDLQLLSRYLDGELPAAESRALEVRLQSESELRTTLIRLEKLNHRLRDLLKENDEVPAAVSTLLADPSTSGHSGDGDNVVHFPNAGSAAIRSTQPRWAYAMAASLVGAVALSLIMTTETTHTLPGNDSLVSAALDHQPSGSDWADLGDGRELQTVLTFPHEDGRWCREYLLRGGDADWRAVACREQGRWNTQAAGLESFLDSTDVYRPAGADDSATVALFISQNAADIALGADDEKALMDRDWTVRSE